MIQHVALETARDDGEAAEAFWRLLGFERVEPPDTLRDRAAWLQRGPTQVHLLWRDGPVAPPEGHAAVVVGTSDYEATLARLRAAGHDVDPRKEHWGSPRAFVRAPGGHRVEVMATSPHASLEARAREAIEQVCSGGFERAGELYDDGFVDHVNEMEFRGRDGIRQSVSLYLAIFDDLRFEVEDQVTDADRVASRWVLKGTHKGRRVTLRGITISRFDNGKIVEDWGYSDTTTLVRQLGPRRAGALGLRWLSGRLR